jgi:cyclophilin family peptidyl-prolyl cis-trans isomerase
VDPTSLEAPRTLKPGISPEVEEAILGALELQPARRFGSAAEMQAALKSEVHTLGQSPGEAPPASRVATISTDKGDILVQLDAKAAPQTVNNFVFLSQEGFYDGLTFHRVEPGFIIQGGDPLGNGTGGPGYTVPAEIKLPHVEGAIAMSRAADQVNPTRASSGSQFYITLAPEPSLDGNYTVFGHVIEGMDVARSIAQGDVIEKVSIAIK